MSDENTNFIPRPPPSVKDSVNHIKTLNISNISRMSILLHIENNFVVSRLKLRGVLIVNNYSIKAIFLRIQTDNITNNISLLKYRGNEEVNSLLKSICEGINNLHSINIPHLNLKPSNILVSSSNEVFISDYSINSIRNPNNIPFSSIQYFSPEQLLDREISYESDVWSFGCIIYYIITKKQLLEGTKIEEIKSKLLNIKLESNDDNNDSLLREYEYLLKLMLRIKPEKRISIKEIFEELNSIADFSTAANTEYNNPLLLFDRNNCILYISNKYDYELCENEYYLINSNLTVLNRIIEECNKSVVEIGNENEYCLMFLYVLINSILYSKHWDDLKCYCYDKLSNVFHKELSMSVYKQFGICFRRSDNLGKRYVSIFVNHLHLLKCLTYLDLEWNGIDEDRELMSIFCDKLSYLNNLKRLKIECFLSFNFPYCLKYLDLFIYSIAPNENRLNFRNQGLDINQKNHIIDLLEKSGKSVVVIDNNNN